MTVDASRSSRSDLLQVDGCESRARCDLSGQCNVAYGSHTFKMSRDRDIERAVVSGERNQQTTELVQNRCVHAKVEKFGGIGLVKQQTGFPFASKLFRRDILKAVRQAQSGHRLQFSSAMPKDTGCCPHASRCGPSSRQDALNPRPTILLCCPSR